MRILAVDPGDKRLGIAISDPTGNLARPLAVLNHVSRPANAARIVALANEQEAGLIIVGQSLNDEGEPTVQGVKSARLAEAIRELTDLPVQLWDEGFSTQDARAIRLQQGAKRRKRGGHMDDAAAAVILQSYLDAQR